MVSVRGREPVGALRGGQAPESLLEAQVKAVDPVADAGTGILRVQLELPNPDFAILAGQQCQLVIEGGE